MSCTQRRFGRARAAEYAHHLAGLDVEVCPAQAETLRVAGIAEIDVFKADGAVLDFLDGVFRVLDDSGTSSSTSAMRSSEALEMESMTKTMETIIRLIRICMA